MKGIAYRPLSDMHTDGVYFDKEEVHPIEAETLCAYSHLPSVQSYMTEPAKSNSEEEAEYFVGHS
jgi:hypothetical protein